MAMTPRERLLAIGVGATVSLFGLQYGFSSIRSSLRDKQAELEVAEQAWQNAEMTETAGRLAGEKLNRLKDKSLPSNPEKLVAQYTQWLLQIAGEAGLQFPSTNTPKTPSQRTSAYLAYDFTLTGRCGTDQAIDLLARFYDKDYLHSVKSLKLNPTKDPNVIDIVLDARALVLVGAPSEQASPTTSSGRLAMSVKEYQQAILDRNPFAPPNQPPTIATGRSQEIKVGESWRLGMEAKDPENQRVDFELVSTDLPEGLRFSGNELSWKPEATGEYEVTVRATDSGWPSQTAEQKLTLRVVEAAKEPPKVVEKKFDIATQAFVSSMVSGRRGPQASIRSRTEGKTVDLIEGGEIEVGEIKAKVVSINLNEEFIELETDGSRWMLDWGTSVAEAYQKSQVD